MLVGGQAGVVEGDPAVVEGHVGSALELAAQVDSVSFDGAGELDLGDDGVTIEAWLRLGENTAGGQNFTASIGKNVFPIAQPYLLTFEGGPIQGGAGPTLPADQWQMEYVLTRSDGTRVHDQRTGLIVTVDGQFHHYAMTYDGSTVRLFIDGVQRYESPFGGDLLSVPEVPLTIGGGAAFAIDEMTIYGRALTAAELAAIQTAASGGKCRPTSS